MKNKEGRTGAFPLISGDAERLWLFDCVREALGVRSGECIYEACERLLAAEVPTLRLRNAARVLLSKKREPWESMRIAAMILGARTPPLPPRTSESDR